MTNHRTTWSAQKLSERVYAEETHCWLCGFEVDQTLPRGHPRSRSVDHIVPLSKGGNPYERSNARLACLGCNSSRGNGDREPFLGVTQGATRKW